MKKIDTGGGGFGPDEGRAFVFNDDAVLTDNTYVHEFTPTTVVFVYCATQAHNPLFANATKSYLNSSGQLLPTNRNANER